MTRHGAVDEKRVLAEQGRDDPWRDACQGARKSVDHRDALSACKHLFTALEEPRNRLDLVDPLVNWAASRPDSAACARSREPRNPRSSCRASSATGTALHTRCSP